MESAISLAPPSLYSIAPLDNAIRELVHATMCMENTSDVSRRRACNSETIRDRTTGILDHSETIENRTKGILISSLHLAME